MDIRIAANDVVCLGRAKLWKKMIACLATIFVLYSQTSIAAFADHLPDDMDLSSTTASVAAPAAGSITEGGQIKDISQGALLTPAEYVALQQVAAGQQGIELNALGAAMGGIFDLCASDHCADISRFVLPAGVTAVGGAQLANSTLSIEGLANIQGSLLLQSVLSSVTAGDLLVSQTGRIASQVADPASTLSIMSANNIVNNGLISSIGNLNLTVGQALTNTGTIESLAGSVSITGLSNNFVIQNTGTISALNGAVNLATAMQQANLSLLGGIVQAQNINFLVPQGRLDVIAEQLNGLVGITAKDLVMKITGDLNIGTIDLSGDPVFEVASYSGTGFTVPGQLVRINAVTSINVTTPISTASSVGDGGDVTLQAGTTVTTLGIDTSSTAEEGDGGQITILAGGAVSTGNLTSSGTGPGGEASNIVVATNGSVTTGAITANSSTAPAAIVVTAAGSITAGDISATVAGGGSEGGFADLIGRTGVTAGNINVNALGAGSTGGGIYVSANGNINLGNLSADGVGAQGGDILLTTAIALGTGTITRGTISVAGAPAGSSQEYTPGAPPVGLHDAAFANAGALTVYPRQLPGGGYTSFSNTGTITLDTDVAGAGFDTVGAFFVNAAGDFGVINGAVSSDSQKFIGITSGTATTGAVSNSSSGVIGVAGDIVLVSYTGNVLLDPVGAYDTGEDFILLINAGVGATSTFGSNPGTTSITFGNDGVVDHFGGGRLLIRSGVGGINMTSVMDGSDFMISDSPVDIDAGPGNLTLGGVGTLRIKAQNVLPGALFSTGIHLAGTQVIFNGPGTRTIQAEGAGLELRANSAAAPFPDLGSITLNISSVRLDGTSGGGDVAIRTPAGDLNNTAAGSINVTLPSSGVFQARMRAAGRINLQNVTVTNGGLIMEAQGAVADSQVNNISVTGGWLRIISDQRRINLVGNILSTSTDLTNNGIFIESGTGCVSCGSRITSDFGVVIRASGGNVILSVVNSDKTALANYPMIFLQGATVQATGYFNGGSPVGGGIALSVNDPTVSFFLGMLLAGRLNDQPPNSNAGSGTIQFDANPAQTASPSISSVLNGGTLSASGDGLMRVFLQGEPNNIFFSFGVFGANANGGVVLLEGGAGSLPGQTAIAFVSGLTMTATLPFSYTVPTSGGGGTVTTPPPVINPPEPDTTPSPDPTIIATDKTPPPAQSLPSAQREIERYENADVINQTMISTNTCTAMSFNEMHDSYFLGESGTTFEVTGERSILLKDGRMFAGAGKNGLRFRTNLADVLVGPKALVLVSAMESKPVRVTNLDSPEENSVEVQVNGETVAQVSSGQEVLVGHELREEELIAADGVERTPVGGTIQKVGMVAQKSTVPVGRLIQREMLLGCHSSSLGTAQAWPFKRLQELKVASQNPAGEPGSKLKASKPAPAPSPNARPFILTSYTTPGNYTLDSQGDWKLVAHVPTVAPQGLKLGPETDLSEIGQGHYRISSGSVLTKSGQTIRLETPNGVVVAKPNAAALVIVEGNLTRVLDLSDRGSSDIRVVSGKHYVDLSPGQEVGLIHSARIDPKKLVSGDGLGRRRMRVVATDSDLQVVVNEFSIVDALSKMSVLKGIRRSSDVEDFNLLYQIMKTAAAVAMSTGKSGVPYSSQ